LRFVVPSKPVPAKAGSKNSVSLQFKIPPRPPLRKGGLGISILFGKRVRKSYLLKKSYPSCVVTFTVLSPFNLKQLIREPMIRIAGRDGQLSSEGSLGGRQSGPFVPEELCGFVYQGYPAIRIIGKKKLKI
jgi:hypothetical protein